MYSSLDIKKVNKIISDYCQVVFKHFRISLSNLCNNFHLEHSFYIDVDKHIISYFNTLKILFVVLLPISCKKMKLPSFCIRLGKRRGDKWWLRGKAG